MAPMRAALFVCTLVTLVAGATQAEAGPLRDRIRERIQERRNAGDEASNHDMADMGGVSGKSCAEWSKKVNGSRRVGAAKDGPIPDWKDVAYGSEALQTLDIYAAKKTDGAAAPIILMVHGGGWCVGDKAMSNVTENKVARWTPKGFIVISANYPMVAEGSNAIAQAHHIAKATAFVQARASEWGGDPSKVILMGHSAGAHLVSLVNADAAIRQANGMKRILGTVSLDAGAIDVVTQMPNVYSFLKMRYVEAFGTTEAEWVAASPFYKIDRTAMPWLGVCSTKRKDDPCAQARAYAEKSNGLGIHAAVLPEAKSHGAINEELGEQGEYTDAVEGFMKALDPTVAALLH